MLALALIGSTQSQSCGKFIGVTSKLLAVTRPSPASNVPVMSMESSPYPTLAATVTGMASSSMYVALKLAITVS